MKEKTNWKETLDSVEDGRLYVGQIAELFDMPRSTVYKRFKSDRWGAKVDEEGHWYVPVESFFKDWVTPAQNYKRSGRKVKK